MIKFGSLWFGAALSLLLLAGCNSTPEPTGELVSISQTEMFLGEAPKNYYLVSSDIWRSGQPTREEFEALSRAGLKSVLNLRHNHRDDDLVAGLPLKLYQIPLKAGSLTRDDLLTALRICRDAEKPLLIHCWHGSDRTGAVVAACRIVFEGWSVDRAIAELLEPRFGHHRLIYRNIPRLLRSIDWEEISRQLREQ